MSAVRIYVRMYPHTQYGVCVCVNLRRWLILSCGRLFNYLQDWMVFFPSMLSNPLPLLYRTVLIEQLMREGVDLKERLSVLQTALHAKKSETEATQEKLREAQMELTEYKEIAEQACGENVLLKNQVQCQRFSCVHCVCVCVCACCVCLKGMYVYTYSILYMYVCMYVYGGRSYMQCRTTPLCLSHTVCIMLYISV